MFARVGLFFVIVSMIVFFVFFASYQVEAPDYSLLLGGIFFMFLGIFMIIRNRIRPEKAERFRLVRRMRSRNKKNGE